MQNINFLNLLEKKGNIFLLSKKQTKFIKKIYVKYIVHNTYILNLKHMLIKINNFYYFFKKIIVKHGKLGIIDHLNFLNLLVKNLKKMNKKFKKYYRYIKIYDIRKYYGGYFTANKYLKKKKITDIFFLGNTKINNSYIQNELFILKKPIISFFKSNINSNLYIEFLGNNQNLYLFYLYNKLIFNFLKKISNIKKCLFYIKLYKNKKKFKKRLKKIFYKNFLKNDTKQKKVKKYTKYSNIK